MDNVSPSEGYPERRDGREGAQEDKITMTAIIMMTTTARGAEQRKSRCPGYFFSGNIFMCNFTKYYYYFTQISDGEISYPDILRYCTMRRRMRWPNTATDSPLQDTPWSS